MLDALNHPVIFLIGITLGVTALQAILRVLLQKVSPSAAALFGKA